MLILELYRAADIFKNAPSLLFTDLLPFVRRSPRFDRVFEDRDSIARGQNLRVHKHGFVTLSILNASAPEDLNSKALVAGDYVDLGNGKQYATHNSMKYDINYLDILDQYRQLNRAQYAAGTEGRAQKYVCVTQLAWQTD